MFGLSFTKIMIIAVLALVLLGPDQLPQAAKKLGQALRMLRQATDSFRAEMSQITQMDPGNDSGLGALRDLHKIATDAAGLVRNEIRALTEPAPAPPVKMAVGIVPAETLGEAKSDQEQKEAAGDAVAGLLPEPAPTKEAALFETDLAAAAAKMAEPTEPASPSAADQAAKAQEPTT